jgi:hypothetical protein
MLARKEKIALVETLCDSVKAKIISEIDNIPESWDGFEIRWYLQDAFSHEARFGISNRKRRSSYLNDKYTKNLQY